MSISTFFLGICRTHCHMAKSHQVAGTMVFLHWWMTQTSETVHLGAFGGYFLIFNVKNRNIQVATEDDLISELPAETASRGARSSAIEHLLAGKKAQTLRTASAGKEKEDNREVGSLSWHVCPSRKEARLREQRQLPLPLSRIKLL